MKDAYSRNHMMDMLRPSDLAPRLGVTTGRVYQLIAEGLIPSVRIGRAIRIPRDAWEQWLKEQSRRATGGQ
jgi:prophage regulatory protein